MKKFLLFSVLSVLLSVFYTVKAQECCFWLENADPDQPTDLYSLNPMSTSLNEWQYYYFKFENNCLLEPNDKVSIDWSFEVNGVKVDALIAGQFGVEIEMKNPMAQSLSNDGYVPSGQLLSGQGLLSTLGCPNNTDYPGGLGGPHPNAYCQNTPMFSYFAQGQNNNLYNFLYVHFLEYASDNNLIRLKINRKSWGDYKLTFKLILRKNGEEYQNEYRTAEGTTHYYIGGKLAQYDRQIGSFTLEEQTYSTAEAHACSGDTIYVGLDPQGNPYKFVETVYIPDTSIIKEVDVYFYNQSDDCIDFIDSVVHYTLTWSPMPSEPTVLSVTRCGAGDLTFSASHQLDDDYPGLYVITYYWYEDAALTAPPVHEGTTYTISGLPVDTIVDLWVTAHILGCEGDPVHVQGTVYRIPEITFTNPANLCPETGTKEVVATITGLYTPYAVTPVWTGATQTSFDDTGSDYIIRANVDVTDDCNREYTYSLEITDNNSGCAATASSSFILNDTEDPTFDVPADYTAYRDADCNYDIDPVITGEPTNVADNCGPVTVTHLDATPVQITGECASNVTIIRTWTVTDHCGNATSKDQVITVKDNTAPTFDVPAAITVYRKDDCTVDTMPSATGVPTNLKDNCTTDESDFTVTYLDDIQTDACPSNITIKRTWTVTDACGNATSEDQLITVIDDIAPTFDAPINITLYGDADCDYDINPDNTGKPTNLKDNCTVEESDFTVTHVDATPVVGPCETTITRTWSVKDQCGNETTADQIITLTDNTPPTFDVPAAITVYRKDDCSVDTMPSATGVPTNLKDNCTVNDADFTITYADSFQTDACPSNITITRTWSVKDLCGNETTATQVITVKDEIAPTFTAPGELFVFRDADCNVDTTTANTGVPTDLFDNCTAEDDLVITYSDAAYGNICMGNRNITRTWTVTDQCGNSTSATQLIKVRDKMKPTFDVPADTTIYRDAACAYDIDPDKMGRPTNVLDNCTPTADIVVDYDDALPVQITGECTSNITITRTWTATDECGNVAEETQVITIKDNTAPTFTAPDDIAICKDGSGNYDASLAITGEPTDLADNCSAAADITVTHEDNVDHVGAITEDGYVLRTFTIKDNCGNAATHVQTITLNPAPVATITADPESFCLADTATKVTIALQPNSADYTFSIKEPTLPVDVITSTTTVEIVTEGDYYFTGIVTDTLTGCSSDPVQVKVEALLYPYFDITTLQDKIGCRDDSLELNAIIKVTPNPNYAYTINPPATFDDATYTFSDLLLQTYTITATHTNGCTYSVDYEVKLDPDYLPVAQLLLDNEDKDIAVCWTSGLTIPTKVQDLNNIPGHSYLFSIIVPTGVIAHGSNYIQITAPGTYKIGGSVFNEVTGCGDTTWHWVYANEFPTLAITNDVPCLGGEINLEVTPTPVLDLPHYYEYEWTNSATSDTIRTATLTQTMNAAITFKIHVTANYNYSGEDAAGNPYDIPLECSKDSTFTITPNLPHEFTLEATHEVEHCNSITPGEITITGWDATHDWTLISPSGTSYEINDQVISVDTGGTYHVISKTEPGCTYTQDVFVDSLHVGFDAILHADTKPLVPGEDKSANLKFCWSTGDTIWHEVRYTNNPIFSYQYTINTPLGISQQNSQSSVVNAPGDYLLSGYVVNLTTNCRSKTDSLYVYAVESPVYTVSTDQEICYGDSVKIGVSYTDTTYKVLWTGDNLNATTDSVTITPAMYGSLSEYTATVAVSNVHDSLTCTVSKEVKITINPIPVFGIPTVDSVTCHGGSDGKITLDVTGANPLTYLWSTTPPETTNTVDNLTAGSYTVTVTDANGCQAVSTPIQVGEPNQIAVEAIDVTHVNCHGDSTGIITIGLTSGGTAPYTYSINGTDYFSTDHFDKLPAGTYTLYVKDYKDCITTFDNNVVTQPAAPVTATLTPTNPSCNGGSNGSIIANPIGGTPHLAPHDGYTYLWSNTETTREITNLAAGTYSVIIKDSLGCEYKDTVTLVAPTAITRTYTVVRVKCHGDNTGELHVTAHGGTPGIAPYEYHYTLRRGSTIVDTNHTGDFTGLIAGYHDVIIRDANNCTATYGFMIREPDAPLTASIAADTVHVNCHGGSTGAASVEVTGGTYPYRYAWSHGHADSTATGLFAGTYSVVVTDDNDCTDTARVTIRQLPEITLTDTTVVDVNCYNGNDGSITVIATGGSGSYQYSINDGPDQASGTFNGLTAGTHTIKVKDDLDPSCYKSFDIVVNQPDAALTLVSALITDSIDCYGNKATVKITATGGTGTYTYLLEGHSPSNTGEFFDVSAGNYGYSVTDENGCKDTCTVKLAVSQPDTLVATIQSSDITHVLCYGDSTGKAKVTVNVNGGTPPYEYSWSNGHDTDEATGLPQGDYVVTVTDAKGCFDTAKVKIEQPTKIDTLSGSVEVVNVKCKDDPSGSITVEATGGTAPYEYSINGTDYYPSVGSYTFAALPDGDYTITIKDDNDCTREFDFTITEPDDSLRVTATATPILCYDSTSVVTLHATGGTTPYTYRFDGTTQPNGEFVGVSAGTYKYSVEDANGCTTLEDSIKIEQPALIELITNTIDVKCNGGNDGSLEIDTVTGGVGPFTYKWNTSDTTTIITDLSAATYTVTVTDANDCSVSYSYVVAQPNAILLTIDPTSATTTCIYDTTKVFATVSEGTPGYTYKWTRAGDTTVLDISDTIYVLPGKYYLTVTDNAGCEKVDSITIESYPVPEITSNEPPQVCNGSGFLVTAEVDPSLTGDWTAQLYSGVNTPEGVQQTLNTSSSITYNVPGGYSDTTLYIVFTFTDLHCTYTHTTDTIKISGEPRLRIYHYGPEDNSASINLNDSIQFHFMVDDLCDADSDLRLAINYQIYKDNVLIDTFSNYFSTSSSMNFHMGLEGTGMTYLPIDYNLDKVESHFPYKYNDQYGLPHGAVLGTYGFDFFYLRFFENREGTITLDYIKEPGEYVIEFQLVSHYKDVDLIIPHGNPIGVFMNTGRVGGVDFYAGTYYVQTLSTNSMTITVNPTPSPAQPFTFERDVAKDPSTLSVGMKIYPNPTTPNEEVKVALTNLSSNGILTVTNINGLVLEQYQIKDITNYHEIVLRINNYAPGIYFVTYRSKEGLVTKKLVIQSR